MTESDVCIWKAPDGICGPDLSIPGEQVPCKTEGCRHYEAYRKPAMLPEESRKEEQE